jgi:hypothetical protein
MLPLEAGEIKHGIGRRSMPLRRPYDLAQAFEEGVQRRMLVAALGAQALEVRANARRLVGADLLGNREMQRQMQEGIRLAACGAPVAVDVALGIFDDRMVLGMERDQFGGQRLQRGISSTPRSGSAALRRGTA